MPSGLMQKMASASGRQGLSAILHRRVLARPLRRLRLEKGRERCCQPSASESR